MYFPRNWEFGSALSGRVRKVSPPPVFDLRTPQLYRLSYLTRVHAEELLIEFMTSVCLPWTSCKSVTVGGVVSINFTGRWNLTIFSVAFSRDIPLVINPAKDLAAICKRRLRQNRLLRCISMSKIWLDGCYHKPLFVLPPIYYLQVKLTAGYARKVVTLLASLTWTKLKWQYQQEATFEDLQHDILWIAVTVGVWF
jgi:hypothetical protein